MKKIWDIKYKCAVCGKLTSGRLPKGQNGYAADTSFHFPRRHKFNGKPCAGNILEAEIIQTKI